MHKFPEIFILYCLADTQPAKDMFWRQIKSSMVFLITLLQPLFFITIITIILIIIKRTCSIICCYYLFNFRSIISVIFEY